MPRKSSKPRSKTNASASRRENEAVNLDRFHGSSEEDHDDDDYSDDGDTMGSIDNDNIIDDDMAEPEHYGTAALEEEGGEPSVSDSDEEEMDSGSLRNPGMANAIQRILGTRVETGQPVVLSKTKTSLQKIAESDKQRIHEMKEKRKQHEDRHLTALHEPLSVATSSRHILSSSSVSRELEEERTHRRVATRGVVALFNAIAQHQKSSGGSVEVEEGPLKAGTTKRMTKHGFLALIKAKATTQAEGKDDGKDTGKNFEGGKKWEALSDGFMMKPAKNWDQDSSDGGDASESAEELDLSDDNHAPLKSRNTKKQRRMTDQ